MKILMVTPYFYPAIGGVENYALNITKGLRQAGHQVVVVCSAPKGLSTAEEVVSGIRVIRLRTQLQLGNTPINPLWLWRLRQIIRTEKPDCINAHTPVPFISDMAARAKGKIRLVLTYHNDLVKPSGAGKYLAKLFYLLLMNRTLRLADEIIATSDYYVQTSKYLAPHISKISIVPPGVDTSYYNQQIDKTWLAKKYGPRRFVCFTGNLAVAHSHKGVDVLIDAIKTVAQAVPDVHLLVVGKGNGIAKYQAYASAAGISEKVSFPGYVSDNQLAKYFAGSDVFVLPSTTDSEGFGMVLLEANACGTAVIGSRIGGIPYALTENQTGLLAEPGDSADLAAKITLLLTDRRLAARLGDAGAKRARQDFSWRLLADKTAAIFEATRGRRHVTHISAFYPPALGGMEKVAYELATRQALDGQSVQVITAERQFANDVVRHNSHNYRVTSLRSYTFAGIPFMPGLLAALLARPTRSVYHAHIAQAFIPEIVLLAARLRRGIFIAHFHLDVVASGKLGALFNLYKRTFFPLMLRSADKVVVFSRAQADIVVTKYGVSSDRVIIVPNAVGDEYFTAHQDRQLTKRPTILFVGRLSKQKNLPQLLQAMVGESKRYQVRLVGDGDQQLYLQELAGKLQLDNITFAGRKNDDDLLGEYREADILVMTSEREGMPLVAIEAMATGLPVVATDVTGLRELITDGKNGLLVPLHDSPALTEALRAVFADKSRYRRLSRNATASVQQYRWDKVLPKINAVYRSCL